MLSTLTGTSSNDAIALSGTLTAAGGAGDDQYFSVTSKTPIIENINEGIDEVNVISSYVMPANIENLKIGYATGVVGNALGNIITGNASAQSIDGGLGNDVLIGGGGGDRFIFNAQSGYDVITDFHAGASAAVQDTISLAGYSQYKSFADVKTALTQVGADTILRIDNNDAVKLLNTQVSDLSASNFLTNLDRSHLVASFNEDFNGLSLWDGQNGGVWRTDYGWGGDRNTKMARNLRSGGEKQIYVDSDLLAAGSTTNKLGINPFSVQDGVLTIHAAPTPSNLVDAAYGMKFTSGMLSTRNSFTQTYGYFEARMELPAGQGAWPAFWLYGTKGDGSELDVMESHSDNQWNGTIHDYTTGTDAAQTVGVFTPDLSTGFHTYGVLWTDKTVTWYLDGTAVKTIDTPPDMHGPMYMLVNLALDGSTADSFQGADLKVDYVRAYSIDNLPDSLNHTVYGNVSADFLSGTTGGDRMAGGVGNDTYYVDHPGDIVIENAIEGTDTVRAAIDYALTANVENLTLVGTAVRGTGNELNNVITGNDLDNVLSGGAGNDTIDGGKGADTMIGGTGNDSYKVDNVGDVIVEQANEGTDTVTASVDYTLSTNVENLTLTGTAVNGTGNELNNILTGNDRNNVLTGGAGNDILDGGAGADTMIGGTGNDNYKVENVGDVVVEQLNEGWDAITTTVDYTLPANVEQLTLAGLAIRGTAGKTAAYLFGSDIGNVLTGSAAADTIDGKAGDDRIIGGGGNDKLTGGAGKDVFVFAPSFGNDTIADFVIGEDRVEWSALLATFAAPTITEVNGSAIATFGKDSITFTGVRAADLIAAKVFDRATATIADTYGSYTGAPVIVPVTESVKLLAPEPVVVAPTLGHGTVGGLVEAGLAGAGVATSKVALTLGGTSPTLALDGWTATGTSGVYTKAGVYGVATLDTGEMTLSYALDNAREATDGLKHGAVVTDSFTLAANNGAGTASDTIGFAITGANDAPAPVDHALSAPLGQPLTVTGAALLAGASDRDGDALTLASVGNAQHGTVALDAKGGAVFTPFAGYVGTAGYDYVVADGQGGTATAHVVVTVQGTVQTVVDQSRSLTAQIVDFRGDTVSHLFTAGLGDSIVYGGDGASTYRLGTGHGTVYGGKGGDLYYVDNAAATIVEQAGGGADTIYAGVDYTAPANVESLVLTGTAIRATASDTATNLFGNALNNVLTGGAGNDMMNGGAGADTMIGGGGNDYYVVDNAGDKVVELAGGGVDIVASSVDYTLGANVEKLVLTGAAISGTGNELDNSLTGNALANILSGGAGNDILDGGLSADTLIGGTGNDIYYVDNAGDLIVEKRGEGYDVIFASVDYKASANVEQLTLTATAIRGTANDTGTVLMGNAQANILTSGAGNDRLTGGAGADTFVFKAGFGKDVITDFNANEDDINWSALNGLYPHPTIADVGGNAVVTFGADSITLLGVTSSVLAQHHIFA